MKKYRALKRKDALCGISLTLIQNPPTLPPNPNFVITQPPHVL